MSENVMDSIEIIKQPLQVFDLVLVENRKPNLKDTEKRKNKYILLRCILSEGGNEDGAQNYDDSEIEDFVGRSLTMRGVS